MKRLSTSRSRLIRTNRTYHSASSRKGSMLIEVIVASILMASLAAIFLPGLAAINRQRLSIRDDALVLVELNNLAEQASVLPPDSLALSDWFQARYPQADLTVEPVEANVSFQPADDGQPNDASAFTQGHRIQITIESQIANLPMTRSLVVWPESASSEGATK